MNMNHAPLPSEQVVIAAPMSLTGSAERIWRMTRGRGGWTLAAMGTLAVLTVIIAWALILAWYATFGLLLIPYRVIRRGQRKRKRSALQHRELLNRLGAP